MTRTSPLCDPPLALARKRLRGRGGGKTTPGASDRGVTGLGDSVPPSPVPVSLPWKVRRIWNLYYTATTSEFKDAKECMGALVGEVCAALDAGMCSAEIAERLGARLLENAQRLEHGAGDDAFERIVLYRLWLRCGAWLLPRPQPGQVASVLRRVAFLGR